MNRYFGTHTLEGEWHALLPRYLLLGDRVRGSRVLDVGCGTGIGSSLLLELGAESVHGVDHRPEVVELARVKHDKQGLDFHVMFWEELKFADDSFDMVVCLDPASPITDPNLLREVRRVLCAGGEYVCALERTKVAGLEELLPRYGYTSSADQVPIGQSDDRVPQVGELSTYFETIISLVQRPHISYVFEPESVRGGGELAEADELRRVPVEGGDDGMWRSEASADGPQGPRQSGQWVPVDRHLSSDDAEVAAVEIFFCGDAHLPPAPLREIRLPYYNIVDRLSQLIGDLQVRQRLDGQPSSFDEVLDEPTGVVDDDDEDARGCETGSEWDDIPTSVHERPKALEDSSRSGVVGLESQFQHLTALHQQMRRDFDRLLHQTQIALTERDEYIDHLVHKVHEWEARFPDHVGETTDEATGEDAGFSETAKTGIFKAAELRSDGDGPLLDDLGADQAEPGQGLDETSSAPNDLSEDRSEREALEEMSDSADVDEPGDADAPVDDGSDTDAPGDDGDNEPGTESAATNQTSE